MRWTLWPTFCSSVLWINAGGIQIALCIHSELVNIDRDVLNPLFDRAGVFIENHEIAHLIAGVHFIPVGGDAQWRDVRPFIDVIPIWA